MTKNVYGNESTTWPLSTILIASGSMKNVIDKKRLLKKKSES